MEKTYCKMDGCDGWVGIKPAVIVSVSIFQQDIVAYQCDECGILYRPDGTLLCDEEGYPALIEGATCIIRDRQGAVRFTSTVTELGLRCEITSRKVVAEPLQAARG